MIILCMHVCVMCTDVTRTQERLQNAIRLLHETKRLEGQRCRDDVATLQRVNIHHRDMIIN